MAPADDSSAPRISSVRDFYDELASQYDAMTGFEMRFERERPAFRSLVDRYRITRALDAGSGSGFHSVLLAQLGVEVSALDLSPEMVRLTLDNARKHDVNVMVFNVAFVDAPAEWDEGFDAVFVMGNSLPHLLSRDELSNALARLIAVLRPGGILFMQCLNYEKILAERIQILNKKEANGITIIRKYDYDSDGVMFSIVTQTEGRSGKKEKRETVRLRPILKDELTDLLRDLGAKAELFGSITLEPFHPLKSADLVVLATKL